MAVDGPVGAWDLVAYELRDASDAVVEHPLGARPLGLLVYAADGHMSVFHARRERTAPDARSWAHLTDVERAVASRGFDSYGGRFEWYGDHVVHEVEVALYPGWIGRRLVRRAELDGDVLVLRAEHTPPGESRPALTWRRRPGAGASPRAAHQA